MDLENRNSWGSVAREVASSFKDVVRSEINLAKVELKDASGRAGKHSAQVAMFSALAAIGVLPLIAFLVIGLGRLLNDNYWLSSLIVGCVFLAVGGLLAFRSYQKIRDEDFSLPYTRHMLERQRESVERKRSEVAADISRVRTLSGKKKTEEIPITEEDRTRQGERRIA